MTKCESYLLAGCRLCTSYDLQKVYYGFWSLLRQIYHPGIFEKSGQIWLWHLFLDLVDSSTANARWLFAADSSRFSVCSR